MLPQQLFEGYIIFADLKGFSKMDETKYEDYAYTLMALDKTLEKYKSIEATDAPHESRAVVWNTWGDALLAVFKNGIDASNFMLTYREFFQKNKALNLEPRIAAHYGEMKLIHDPMLNGNYNVLGDNVNLAARIEPITFPGEIYVTVQFKAQFEKEMMQTERLAKYEAQYDQITFQHLEEWSLPKNFKIAKVRLYRLFHVKEQAWNINELFIEQRNTTLDSLYGVIDIDKELQHELNQLREELAHLAGKEEIITILQQQVVSHMSGPQLYAIAKIYQELGEYEMALTHIQQSQKWEKVVGQTNEDEGVVTQPLMRNTMLLKLEADCLSKSSLPDKYKRAKRILYEVLQMDPKSSDTLCKLAAQMKREAFSIADQQLEAAKKNLQRSLDLYLEAFRLQGEYYPAVNATYIKRVLNADDSWQLANYIFNTWKNQTDESWWIDSTLAESQMLMKDYPSAIQRMQRAIQKHQPKFSELEATYIQIDMYKEMLTTIAGKPHDTIEHQKIDEILAVLNVQRDRKEAYV